MNKPLRFNPKLDERYIKILSIEIIEIRLKHSGNRVNEAQKKKYKFGQ